MCSARAGSVRAAFRAGKSDQEIVDYMVDRYGEFVLYRPPVKASTILLWVGPFAILVSCLLILLRVARRRRSEPAVEIDEERHEKAQRLLRED